MFVHIRYTTLNLCYPNKLGDKFGGKVKKVCIKKQGHITKWLNGGNRALELIA